jgi:hypothetical protein
MEGNGAHQQPQPASGGDVPGGNTWAIVALVLGLIAAAVGLVSSAIDYELPLVLGIVAVVFGVLGIQRGGQAGAGRRGMAIWGLVLGVVGLLLGVANYVLLQQAFDGFGGSSAEEGGSSEDRPAIGKTVRIGQPLKFPNEWTVTIRRVKQSPTLTPREEYSDSVDADGVFYILDLEVENRLKKASSFDDSMIDLVDEDGTVYSASTGKAQNQIGTLKDYLDESEVQPKGTERGRLAFDIPSEANVVKAQVSETFDFSVDDPNYSYVELK